MTLLQQQLDDQQEQLVVHQLEIRSLKEQNIQLLEERHYKATAAYMENAIHMSAPQPPQMQMSSEQPGSSKMGTTGGLNDPALGNGQGTA